MKDGCLTDWILTKKPYFSEIKIGGKIICTHCHVDSVEG